MRRESASCQSTIELTDRRFRWHCLSVSSNGLPPRSRSLGRTITQTAASERPDCQRYWLYINFLVNNVVFVVVILSVSLPSRFGRSTTDTPFTFYYLRCRIQVL